MIELVPVGIGNLELFRTVRLGALEESPRAFGSTYAREAQFEPDDWVRRVQLWNGERGIGYLAIENGAGCGIAGGFLDEAEPRRADLVSIWTVPSYRRQGVGRLLVEGVMGWARRRGVHSLRLMVTSSNEAAIGFYLQLGFQNTGGTQPYPNDAALVEYEMVICL
jgi:ribosomal protein S18 acetylase RimI-like enzyme